MNNNLLIALKKIPTFHCSLAMNSRFVQFPHNLKDKQIGCAWGKKKSLSLLGMLLINCIFSCVSNATMETRTKSLSVWLEDPTALKTCKV